MLNDIQEVLLSQEEIAEIVEKLGTQISRDYEGKNLILVGILKGSVVFISDLMRKISIPAKLDFMSVSSYGSGVKTSGVVKILKDLDIDVTKHDILLVEDILDSGMTLHYLMEVFKKRNPKSIAVCTLLNKPDRRKIDVNVAYEGKKIPDEFVVGYGLDFAEKYRNLPFIGILRPSVYEK